MALFSKSIDEILTLIADAYDALIAPKRIFRDNNNKWWLGFRAIAAGYSVIQDSALALNSQFDPALCPEENLVSTGKMMGTKQYLGAGSLLRIIATNNDTSNAKTLYEGTYAYTSLSGEVFSFELALDTVIAALGASTFVAISAHKGSFQVADIASITVSRPDLATIDPAFTFACINNAGTQGYPDEDLFAFRQRMLTDTSRQDIIAEMELAIRNLPNILECDIVFNATAGSTTYDGITLEPYQILIMLTGSPTSEVALEVVSRTAFHTYMDDPAKVVYFTDPHYIGGAYPVYYKNHLYSNFTINLDYRYDSTKILKTNADAAIQAALAVYSNASQRIPTLTEDMVYSVVKALALPSVQVLNVDLLVGGVAQPYIDFLSTRLPNMTSATVTGTDVAV